MYVYLCILQHILLHWSWYLQLTASESAYNYVLWHCQLHWNWSCQIIFCLFKCFLTIRFSKCKCKCIYIHAVYLLNLGFDSCYTVPITIAIIICVMRACTPSLTQILIRYIGSGIFPNDWKEAKVLPLYKSGAKTDPGNYNP